MTHVTRHPSFPPLRTTSGAGVILRFDDGTEDTYTIAATAMRQRGLVGCVGMITDNIGKKGSLSAGQLRMLERWGWEIASHTKTHASCNTISAAELAEELDGSIEALVSAGVRYPDTFIYPSGARNAATDKAVYQRFKKAFATTIHHATPHKDMPAFMFPYGVPILSGATLLSDIEIAKRTILRNITAGQHTIITFHKITPKAPMSGVQLHIRDFYKVIDWITKEGVPTILPKDTEPHNLILDGSFERFPFGGLEGYTSAADVMVPWRTSIADDDTKYSIINDPAAPSGKKVVEFDSSNGSGTPAADHIRQAFAHKQGRVYRVRYQENITALTAGDIRCTMRPHDIFGNALTTQSIVTSNAPTTGWVERSATYTPPANTAYIAFSWSNSSANGKAYLDNVTVYDSNAHDFLS